jgi:uncharacterized membrane protein YeaQ/YmgE (transglycosylase-associated protein family)
VWIVWSALVGLVVGMIARLVVPGRHPRGLLVTIAVGVAGSVLASVAGHATGFYHGSQSAGFPASVIGAVVLLLALQALGSRSRSH